MSLNRGSEQKNTRILSQIITSNDCARRVVAVVGWLCYFVCGFASQWIGGAIRGVFQTQLITRCGQRRGSNVLSPSFLSPRFTHDNISVWLSAAMGNKNDSFFAVVVCSNGNDRWEVYLGGRRMHSFVCIRLQTSNYCIQSANVRVVCQQTCRNSV